MQILEKILQKMSNACCDALRRANSEFKEEYFGNELRHFFASEKTTAAPN